MKCPLCNGKGTVPDTKHMKMAQKIGMMRDKGISIRKIMKMLGWRSTNTVCYYIKKGSK